MKTLVSVPLFISDNGRPANSWIQNRSQSVFVADLQPATHDHVVVAELESGLSKTERQDQISKGLTAAHAQVHERLNQDYGEGWRQRGIDYHFGNLEFNDLD